MTPDGRHDSSDAPTLPPQPEAPDTPTVPPSVTPVIFPPAEQEPPTIAPPAGAFDWRSHIIHDAGSARLRAGGLCVADVLRDLAGDESVADLLSRRPSLGADDVRACLALAAEAVASER